MEVVKRGEITGEKEDIVRETLDMSTMKEVTGVMEVKNNACEVLLKHRVEHKLKQLKIVLERSAI